MFGCYSALTFACPRLVSSLLAYLLVCLLFSSLTLPSCPCITSHVSYAPLSWHCIPISYIHHACTQSFPVPRIVIFLHHSLVLVWQHRIAFKFCFVLQYLSQCLYHPTPMNVFCTQLAWNPTSGMTESRAIPSYIVLLWQSLSGCRCTSVLRITVGPWPADHHRVKISTMSVSDAY